MLKSKARRRRKELARKLRKIKFRQTSKTSRRKDY